MAGKPVDLHILQASQHIFTIGQCRSIEIKLKNLKDLTLKPLTHVASKWSFLGAICPSQGSSWKLLQPLQRLAGHLLALVLLQQITYNDLLAMLVFIQ